MKPIRFSVTLAMFMIFMPILVSQLTGEWVFNEYPENGITGIGLLDDEIYLVLRTEQDRDPSKFNNQVRILKMGMNWNGEIPDLPSVYSNDNASRWLVRGDLARTNGHWVFVENGISTTSADTLFVTLMDDNFNVMRQETRYGYTFIDPYCSYSFDNGEYVGLGTALQPPDSLLRVLYNPIQSDTITLKAYLTQLPVSYVTSMTFDHLRNRFLIFHLGGISHLNDTLEVIQRFSGDVLQTEQHGTILSDDSGYYSLGATQFLGSPDLRDVVFQKYDTSMNVLFSETYGRSGEDDFPFIVRSLDTLDDQYIIGGMYGGPAEFLFRIPLVFFLAKYDSELNRLWYQEFGGDHSYQIRGLHMLEDGRCMIYGWRADKITGLRYPYLLIVNEDGLISSTEDINEPVPDLIQLFSSGITDLSFEANEPLDDLILYTMDGKIVKTFGNVGQGRYSYDLSAVPSALYLLVARSDNGRMQSVKWLKQ